MNLILRVLQAMVCACLVSSAGAQAPRAGMLNFIRYDITDPNFGGMRVSSLSIPAGWRAQSQVRWDFSSANYPVKVHLRVQSPDGKTWVEMYPYDAIFAMQPPDRRLARGTRTYGALYMPGGLAPEQAMLQLLVQPARGGMPGFQVLGTRPVDAQRLATAYKQPQLRGDAMHTRVRYTLNGQTVDEDFYALYTALNTIPYHGPQGTSYEYHRMLALGHSVGATDGLLPTVYPILAYMLSTLTFDEQFQAHVANVQRHIVQQFNAALQRGYDSIAAAGQLSRAISANNDALLASMQQRRAAQQQADATRRAAANAPSSGGNGFSDYLRGTTRMNDPYWGESAQSSNYSYHWTDSQGNYRASNDPGFNPNVGAGGGATWQRMESAR